MGLKYLDEGFYLINGGRLAGVVGDCGIHWAPFTVLKPLHEILIAISIGIFGYHDYSAILPSVILGTLTILVVFFIGKQLYDWQTGIIAASILSVMEYHIAFSRSALTEVNMVFLSSLTILFYVLAKKENYAPITGNTKLDRYIFLILTGLAAGLCFEMRYTGVLILLPILFLEFIWVAFDVIGERSKPIKRLAITKFKIAFRNQLVIMGSFLLVFFAAWALLNRYGFDNYLFFLLSRVTQTSIGNQIVTNIPVLNAIPTDPSVSAHVSGPKLLGFMAYSLFFYKLTSILTLVFVFLGIAVCAKMRTKSDAIILVWATFFFVLVVWEIIPTPGPRHAVDLLPPLALLAARGFYIFRTERFNNLLSNTFKSKVSINQKHLMLITLLLLLLCSLYSSIDTITFTNPSNKKLSEVLIKDNVTVIASGGEKPIIAAYTKKYIVDMRTYAPDTVYDRINYLHHKNVSHIVIFSNPPERETYKTIDKYMMGPSVNMSLENYIVNNCNPIATINYTPIKYIHLYFKADEWESPVILYLSNKLNFPYMSKFIYNSTTLQKHKIYIYRFDEVFTCIDNRQ